MFNNYDSNNHTVNESQSSLLLGKENDGVLDEVDDAWRCACKGSFLPPGMLKDNFGGVEAAFYAGTGKCYHKQR